MFFVMTAEQLSSVSICVTVHPWLSQREASASPHCWSTRHFREGSWCSVRWGFPFSSIHTGKQTANSTLPILLYAVKIESS